MTAKTDRELKMKKLLPFIIRTVAFVAASSVLMISTASIASEGDDYIKTLNIKQANQAKFERSMKARGISQCGYDGRVIAKYAKALTKTNYIAEYHGEYVKVEKHSNIIMLTIGDDVVLLSAKPKKGEPESFAISASEQYIAMLSKDNAFGLALYKVDKSLSSCSEKQVRLNGAGMLYKSDAAIERALDEQIRALEVLQ